MPVHNKEYDRNKGYSPVARFFYIIKKKKKKISSTSAKPLCKANSNSFLALCFILLKLQLSDTNQALKGYQLPCLDSLVLTSPRKFSYPRPSSTKLRHEHHQKQLYIFNLKTGHTESILHKFSSLNNVTGNMGPREISPFL